MSSGYTCVCIYNMYISYICTFVVLSFFFSFSHLSISASKEGLDVEARRGFFILFIFYLQRGASSLTATF